MEKTTEDIDKKYPKLDLQNFVIGTDNFIKLSKRWLFKIDEANKLYEILPRHLKDYSTIKNISYTYQFEPPSHLAQVLDGEFFSDIDKLLGFLNQILEEYGWDENISSLINIIDSPAFDLPFKFDDDKNLLVFKLDNVNTQVINTVNNSLTDENSNLYELCVADFLSPKITKNQKDSDYFHECLDRLMDVLELVLKKQGISKGISQKNAVQDAVIGEHDEDLMRLIEYIQKNVLHNEGQNRAKISRRKFEHIWLQMNNIIFLLSK